MKLTLSIIAICVIVFILQSLGIVGDGLAFMPAQFPAEPYTILTSMFMHSGVQHLLLNMLGLFTFGTLLEHEVGKKRWLIIYLVSGFIASLGYALLSKSPFIPAVGASGAIFGLIGSVAMLKPKAVIYTPYGPLPMIAAAVLWGATEFVSLFSIDNIAHSAHLFGLFGGAIFALVYMRNIDWKITLPLIIIPVIGLFYVTGGMPHSLPDYAPILPDCYVLADKSETTNSIIKEYECNRSNYVLAIVRPAVAEFNMGYYGEYLPELSRTYSKETFGNDCAPNITNIDDAGGFATVSGTICKNTNFNSLAKVCQYSEIIVIQLCYEKSACPLTEIKC